MKKTIYFLAPSYQFVWDNVGKQAHSRFQLKHRNANYLWAMCAAVADRTTFWQLPRIQTTLAVVSILQIFVT